MLRSVVVLSFVLPLLGAAEPETLPIRRVVLYKHGIGYFEREGVVTGDAAVALRFEQSAMSDVLKTLTALDRSGGSIAAIAYDSQKPADVLLGEFGFDLRQPDIQVALLTQLRGARVTADVAGRDTLHGAVLGIDHRSETREGIEVKVPRLSIATDEGAIVTADLFDVSALRFDDPDLAAEIARFLAVLRSTHRRDAKTVELSCLGAGTRDVFVAYAIEQPVWKATYRIVLPEDAAAARPLLQGWAIVDNASDEDWRDVTLSLVAGLPVSFRHDLYTPLFVERPTLELPTAGAEGLAALGYTAGVGPRTGGGKRNRKADEDAMEVTEQSASFRAFDDELERQQVRAVARDVGDLLEYRIDHPVTIPQDRSALLPIVSARVEGERVSLYDESLRSENPMSAVRLVNTSGLTLEGGPVTVLDGDTYAGEAMLGTVKPQERRYVPFAVDLGVHASGALDSRSDRVHAVQIARGVMTTRYLEIERRTCTFENRDTKPRVVVVEHPRRNGYELREPREPFEQELGLYRFRVDVPAGATAAVTIVEAQERAQSTQIANVSDQQIALFLAGGALNAQAESLLREIVARQAAIRAARAQVEAKGLRLQQIDANQDRVRKNLAALGQTEAEKELRARYVADLAADEEEVESLSRELVDAEAQAQELARALDDLLAAFTLEYEP